MAATKGKRGGARPGAGRPRKAIGRVDVPGAVSAASNEGLLVKLRKQAADLELALEQVRQKGATARDIATLNTTLGRIYAQIGRITGEGELSEATILKSPALTAIIGAITDALSPYPEAATAVRDAIGKLVGAKAPE